MPGRIAGQLATAPTAARLIFGTTKRDIKISLVVTRDIFTGLIVTKQCDRVNVRVLLYDLQPFTAPLNWYF